jgi:hypothetical protein
VWVGLLAVEAAVAGGGADFLSLFERVQRAWETGGLAFIFFIGLALFFTGRIFTGRDRERLEKQMAKLDADWKTRYDENDRRWERQLEEVKGRAAAQEGLLYQMMGMQREATNVAKRATTVAQQATAGTNTLPPETAP